MTKEELFRAVGEVREDQIAEAEDRKSERRPWRRYGALAACLAVVLAGAFALERLEGARKWAVIEENFQTADHSETAPEDGGGEESAQTEPPRPEETPEGDVHMDGYEDAGSWAENRKLPDGCRSENVEIRELRGDLEEDKEDQTGTSAASCLAWLSPEEIFAWDTAIFRGTVRALRYYMVDSGGFAMQYTAADVEITDVLRGDLRAGETRSVLYLGGPNMTTSISGPLERLEVGSDAVFMPIAATAETGRQEGDSWFCYADLADFYLSEGLRFVFLDTGEGLDFERGVYEEIADAVTLDDVEAYIRKMTAPELAQSPGVSQEPHPADIDPALLDPSCGVEGHPADAQ